MKGKLLLFSLVLILIALVSRAQTSNIHFKSINQAGMIGGSSGSAFQLQTINGISCKTFSAGIGVGFDHYYQKSIPLFIDLRKNISGKMESPFIYVDLGCNLPWKLQDSTENFNTRSKGLYYDFGAGYNIPLKKNLNIVFSLGYSVKTFTEKTTYYFIQPFPGLVYDADLRYSETNYSFRRLSLKAGISF